MVKLTMKPTNISGVSQFEFEADSSITVGDLKELLSPQLGGLAPQCIRLVCAGRVWLDASTLESYKVAEGSIVHCLNNPQAQSTTGIASTQELQPANPMAQMMGAGMPMGGAGGGDSLQQMMAQSQQMMQQNPEMMQQMMESPMVQQMMENPDVMRSIMQMNPQTRQLMEEHPEIARMLEDPETLRQSARMASNPSLMREMMRNQDTAMGRLDAMPGGHAALARMHRDVVDPMQNAMTAGGDSNTSINQYSENAQGHRNTAPLSNPWGPSQPAAQPVPSATRVTQATPPAAGRPVDPMQQLMQMQSGGANPMAQMMQPGGGNPMAHMMQNPQMMQQMMQNPQMQQMIQQMTQNPEMMQQMMQMSAHMFGQQPGGVHGADGTTQPPNPMANMMQQMMQNPQMMQQVMQTSQQMFGQQGSAGMPGMFGQYPMGHPPMFGAPPAQTGAFMDEAAVAAAASNPMVRARFAQQLDAMIAMGFSDEQRCLQALVQCDGNVDRALDKMFANN